MIHRLIQIIGEFLYPEKCVLCNRILPKGQTELCTDCLQHTRHYPYGMENPQPGGKTHFQFLDSFTAVWYYEGNVRRSIIRYKYYNHRLYRHLYGRLLAEQIRKVGPQSFDLLTWVPISPQHLRKRGYDQSQLVAEELGKNLAVEPIGLLEKIRNTAIQSRLKSTAARKANVMGAYRILGETDLRDKRILILDDILTSGATAEECARMLLTAGAKEVHCAVIASAHTFKNKPSR